MRNITGSPVEGDDFFDRGHDLRRFQRELDNDGNLLVIAPRRVGKTSLVLRLCELRRASGWTATMLNVEGCHDEIAFAERLVDHLRREGLHAETMTRMMDTLRRARQAIGHVKVGLGIDVELDGIPDLEHGTLSAVLESMFRQIETSRASVLIGVDELPELLLAISSQENGDERVRRLLHWLRALRQNHRHCVRWVLLGSIGLDNFVEERSLAKTINDLTVFPLDAFNQSEAHEFLERLGADNRLQLSGEVRQQIINTVGWPLPYHLQLMFHALIDLDVHPPGTREVNLAFEQLLRPENFNHFDTWWQRLRDQFSPVDEAAAKQLLKHLCQHPQGRSRRLLLDVLLATRPQIDPEAVEEQLAKLLLVLQRDGYLIQQDSMYAFRSFLLREYWNRREHR
jgi:hypothetical protein